MALLCDNLDPTTALFISPASAHRASLRLMQSRYAERVARTSVRPRKRQGELCGYALIVHFKDKRPPSPLTNSDFERIAGA